MIGEASGVPTFAVGGSDAAARGLVDPTPTTTDVMIASRRDIRRLSCPNINFLRSIEARVPGPLKITAELLLHVGEGVSGAIFYNGLNGG